MQRRSWITGLAGLLVTGWALGSGSENADAHGSRPGCTNRTLRGAYGIQMQGTNPVPGQPGSFQAVIGVVIRTYDGDGSFTQFDNVKGAVSGIELDRPGFGTYHVNADCTAVTQFEPTPGLLLEERMVIVQQGNEVRSIVANPQPVMISTVQKRVDRR
jgi:hypothetical protein